MSGAIPAFRICPPVYEETTYGLEEFIADSVEISKGKYAILELEQQAAICPPSLFQAREEVVKDGDVLSIVLYHPKRKDHIFAFQRINASTGFSVCAGKVNLPQLGAVEVQGLTLNAIKEKIQAAYQEQLPESQIFIDYKKRGDHYVQIIGAQKNMIPVNGNSRLSEVLAKAGIPPSSNLFKSSVMREGQQLPIDLYKLIHEGDESQNIFMRGGDQIFIAHSSDAAVMVTGEVRKPVVIPVPYGFISLREAITLPVAFPSQPLAKISE